MATRYVQIDKGGMPTNAADCYQELASVLLTTGAKSHLIWRCGASNSAQPTVKAGFAGTFTVPSDYSTSAAVVFRYTSTVTSGNIVWDFDYRSGGNVHNTAGWEESVTGTGAAAGTSGNEVDVTISLTSGNLAANDFVQFAASRDGTDGSDTMAGSALLVAVYFKYDTA